MDWATRLAPSQRAVVIFSTSSCCMCHAIKRLFGELGVNPDVHELAKILGRKLPVPAVFVGGKLVGSTDRVMALHLGRMLVPLLRDAGALWL